MVYRAICVALLCSSLPLVGCGTVANLVGTGPAEGGKVPFGGVKQDVECIQKASNGDSPPQGPALFSGENMGCSPGQMGGMVTRLTPMLFSAVDLPFTLIGDFVTWPYTAAYTFINSPVPTPPVIQATVGAPPQSYFSPENKEPEKKEAEKMTPDKKTPEKKEPEKKTPEKDADKVKPKDDKPTPLPVLQP